MNYNNELYRYIASNNKLIGLFALHVPACSNMLLL